MQSLLQPIDLPLSNPWFFPPPPPPPPQPFYSFHHVPPKSAHYHHQHLHHHHRSAAPFVFGRLPPQPLVPDRLALPELDPTSSPSEPGSPVYGLLPPTPSPQFVHVVCNAPLLAPKPLPYRPPAFLSAFDLPHPDADLSRPPYTNAAAATTTTAPRSKRKRTSADAASSTTTAPEDAEPSSAPAGKRRATDAAWRGRVPTATLNGIAAQRRYSS